MWTCQFHPFICWFSCSKRHQFYCECYLWSTYSFKMKKLQLINCIGSQFITATYIIVVGTFLLSNEKSTSVVINISSSSRLWHIACWFSWTPLATQRLVKYMVMHRICMWCQRKADVRLFIGATVGPYVGRTLGPTERLRQAIRMDVRQAILLGVHQAVRLDIRWVVR